MVALLLVSGVVLLKRYIDSSSDKEVVATQKTTESESKTETQIETETEEKEVVLETDHQLYMLQGKEAVMVPSTYGCAIGILSADAQAEDLQKAKANIDEMLGGEANYAEFSEIKDLALAMYSQTLDGALLTDAQVEEIAGIEGYTDFAEKTESPSVTKFCSLFQVGENLGELDSFLVYLSGIDVFGNPDVVSRSDVNLLVAVNTKTKHIQMVNTPRDSFVELANHRGSKDKLTHAGLGGVENSMSTLQLVYGRHADFYMRMNFSGFQAFIDALGGVDVYSEKDFTVEPIKHYTEGMNHLSGIEALAFVRERHAFASGDHQRGKNQMALVKGMLDKVMQPQFLFTYAEALDKVDECFETNLSKEQIYQLVRILLAGKGEWTVDTYSVNGTSGKEYTVYSKSQKTYVLHPNKDDLAEAKAKLEAVLNE